MEALNTKDRRTSPGCCWPYPHTQLAKPSNKNTNTYTKKYKYKGQENHSRLLLAVSTHEVGKTFVKKCWQKSSVLKCLVKKTLNQIIRPLGRNSPKSVLYLYLIKGVSKFDTL